ncbi:hypothetical protein G6F57_019641 [Rhizopus arrhizus]|nr:hypothetical protein G6F57_019641 [Rhizopus arrhizus]
MRLTITQEEVGYLARVSRQRANQALRKLEEAGLLNVEYGAVRVLDLDGLKLRFQPAAAGQPAVFRLVLDLAGDEQGVPQAAARSGPDLSTVPGDAGAGGGRRDNGDGYRRPPVPGFRDAHAVAQAPGGRRPGQPQAGRGRRAPGDRHNAPWTRRRA